MNLKKINILFIIPNLNPGGAERVLIYLASTIDNEKFNSELIVIGNRNYDNYSIEKTKVTFLGINRVVKSIPKLVCEIRKRKPDLVMGTLAHVNVTLGLISVFFPKIVFLGRQTSIINIYKSLEAKPFFDWYYYFEKIALRQLNGIICQSRDMAHDCQSLYKISDDKIKVINNPITDSFKPELKERIKNHEYRFITVGRLVPVKGHKRILKILSKFKKPFKYTIIGDGPLKEEIDKFVNDLGFKEKIEHVFFTKDVSKYLKQSDFYLQGSLSEGFPNALLESCAVGTPVIAFDVPGGTKEIVENGINGFMVKDEEEFLYRLNHLPKLNPKSVSESVYKKFDKSIILKKYEDFFMESAN